MRARDRDTELELQDLRERRQREIRAHHLVTEARRQERALQAQGTAVDESEAIDREEPRAAREAERRRHAPLTADEAARKKPRGDVLPQCGKIAGEAAELEDVVVDRRRRHERSEPVPALDQLLALEHLERLPQGHEGDAEALRELALRLESGARRQLTVLDASAELVGDSLVAWHSCSHSRSIRRCSRTLSRNPLASRRNRGIRHRRTRCGDGLILRRVAPDAQPRRSFAA